MSSGKKQRDAGRGADQQRSAKPQSDKRSNKSAGQAGWSLWVRVLVSVVVVWHLLVVFLSPLSQQPSSPLVVSIAQSKLVRLYSEPLYLNHGYHFFAPDPGPGHLIRYTLFDASGNEAETNQFPSLRDQWPRLRYHRYMMLADQIDIPAPEQIRRDRANFILTRFAWQILRDHPKAESVRIQRIEHRQLTPEEFLVEGLALDDERTYRAQFTPIIQTRANLEAADKRAELPPSQPETGPGEQVGVPEPIIPGGQP